MKAAFVLLAVVSLAAPAWAQSDRSQNSETQIIMPEPAMLGAHLARGVKPPQAGNGHGPFGGGGSSSPNLTYHNGPVAAAPTFVQPIFWGQSWSDPTFVGDKITGLKAFYEGSSLSSYLGTNGEYTQADGTFVSTDVNVSSATAVDTSTAPKRAPQTSAILAEVCKVFPNPVEGGYYPVYVDSPRGHAGYCAWHSWGSCNGTPITFAFFFNLDGDSGCDPQDPNNVHSQGLEALANVTGHELSEMLTDPRGSGWYDSNGAENADKCAWRFGSPTLAFTNGTSWKIQGNWSNYAYDHKSGYYQGCIDH